MVQQEGLLYRVEPMTIRDIPTISTIEQAVFALPWSATAFRYEIDSNAASEYYTARYAPWVRQAPPGTDILRKARSILGRVPYDRSIVGYGGFWVIVDEAHICTLAVSEAWRGRGLGELLLVTMIDKARRRGAEVVTLEVRVGNSIAQSLYFKYGFEIVGRRKRYYSDSGEDALIMTTAPITSSAYQRRFRALAEQLDSRLLAERAPLPVESDESP